MTTSPGARTDGLGEAWTGTSLVALDLEGSGAQDHEDEAILEIAIVPLPAGQPDRPPPTPPSSTPAGAFPAAHGSHRA
jgi:hypothetical protein